MKAENDGLTWSIVVDGFRSWKWEAGSGELEVGSWEWEAGSGKLEVGSWKWEAGSGKLEVGSWKWGAGSGELEDDLPGLLPEGPKAKLLGF